jgi:hypothetical protein
MYENCAVMQAGKEKLINNRHTLLRRMRREHIQFVRDRVLSCSAKKKGAKKTAACVYVERVDNNVTKTFCCQKN